MTADATSILPDHDKGILRVNILGPVNNATERTLLPLIDELNQTEITYPGTNLHFVCDIDGALPPNRLT